MENISHHMLRFYYSVTQVVASPGSLVIFDQHSELLCLPNSQRIDVYK